jgi:hypothetical protein
MAVWGGKRRLFSYEFVYFWEKTRPVSLWTNPCCLKDTSSTLLPRSLCPWDCLQRQGSQLTATCTSQLSASWKASIQCLWSSLPVHCQPLSNSGKAWQSSMAAWKWVLEPLRWVIPLSLNCCLNSGSHKLHYSYFIKTRADGWSAWLITQQNYLPKEGPEPECQMPLRKADPTPP